MVFAFYTNIQCPPLPRGLLSHGPRPLRSLSREAQGAVVGDTRSVRAERGSGRSVPPLPSSPLLFSPEGGGGPPLSAGPDDGIFGAACGRLAWWRGAGTPAAARPVPAAEERTAVGSGRTRRESGCPGAPAGTSGSDPHLGRCGGGVARARPGAGRAPCPLAASASPLGPESGRHLRRRVVPGRPGQPAGGQASIPAAREVQGDTGGGGGLGWQAALRKAPARPGPLSSVSGSWLDQPDPGRGGPVAGPARGTP